MNKTSRRRWRWAVPACVAALALALALVMLLALAWLSPAAVTGQLVEYHDDAPLVGATVTLRRHGWGRSEHDGYLIWDKAYIATSTTLSLIHI